MKILHTADWHLGKRLDSFSRHDEQVIILQELIQIADKEKVDVVIIAGDLYDSVNPPMESQSLFYKTLKTLAKDGARPIIAIAGNHDSPERIDSPDPLAKECGIIFIGKPKAVVETFEVPEKFKIVNSTAGFFELLLPNHPPLRIIHTAFANEHRLKTYLGEDKAVGLNELLQEHWQLLADTYCDNKGINMLITHLFMQQKDTKPLEEPEGEKPLNLGNADMVYTQAIPTQIQYTALGHLHRYHNIGTTASPVIYSGSPIAYSFSEATQQKYLILVEVEPNKPVKTEKIPLQKGKVLYRKTFASIDEAVSWLQEHPNCLVELTMITETFLTPSELKQLYDVHDGIVFIIPKITSVAMGENDKQQLDLNKDVVSLFEDYFIQKKGIAPSVELLNIFKEVLEN
jgi:exonuclease SbcD